MSLTIGAIDATVIIIYLLLVVLLGLWIGRNQQDSADYFLGGRSLPWGALLLSIVATETSTVTFLSIPGIAAASGGDFTFLQIAIGYIVGRFFVIVFLLPLYFKGAPFTAYEVLERRFGKLSRRTVAGLFLVTRNVSDALRLFLTALVLQIVVGLDIVTSIAIIGVVTIMYTFVGGAKSVIWNDCVQFAIYLLGAAAIASIIVGAAPGGLAEIVAFADDQQKLRLFDFDFSLVKPSMTFWAGLAGGAFLTAATHGTDQLMVQRYLSARRQRDAALALGASGLIVLLQFALFLAIGAGLSYIAVAWGPGTFPASLKNDQLLAYFVVHYMPAGLLGLTLAAVFAAAMSTLSSSLNSSAAAFCTDIYLPLRGAAAGADEPMRAGRIATVAFGIVQAAIAILFAVLGSDESTVSNVLKISGFATGPVLGLYLLAVFATRVEQRAALAGFVAGIAVLSWLALATALYWPWYALVGALATLICGLLAAVGLAGAQRPGVTPR